MATAYVQEAHGKDFVVTSVGGAFGSNVTAGNFIVGMVWWNTDTVTLNSVTDTLGHTYTLLLNPTTDNGNRAALFYTENTSGGADTVTANFSGSTNASIGCHEVSGAATSGAVDKSAINPQWFTGTGSNHITSGSVTTTTNGQYIFGASACEFGATLTAGTGFTLRSSGVNEMHTESQVQGAAGAIAATFTPSADDGYLTGILTVKGQGDINTALSGSSSTGGHGTASPGIAVGL